MTRFPENLWSFDVFCIEVALKILVFLFFSSSLMPFVSPYPIGADVQPLAAVFAAALFLVNASSKGKIRLTYFEIFFLLFAIISVFYFPVGGGFDLGKRAAPLCAFFVYHASSRYLHRLPVRALYLAAFLSTLGVFWHRFSPGTFIGVADNFVRTVKISDFSNNVGRGASGFSAEPSFAAAVSITHALISYFLYRLGRISYLAFATLLASSVISIFLTRSGLGFVFGVSILAVFVSCNISIKRALMGGCGLVFMLVIMNNFDLSHSRGGMIMKAFLKNPASILDDASIVERLVGFHVGITSLKSYPLGRGVGGYPSAAQEAYTENHLMNIYASGRPQVQETVSSFGYYTAELGLLFLFLVFRLLARSLFYDPFSISAVFLSFLFIFGGFSLALPLIYLLLTCSHWLKIDNRRNISRHVMLLNAALRGNRNLPYRL